MSDITVQMPAYNTEKFMDEAFKNILIQDQIDFELILVDDNSTDSTSDIVRSFKDSRIKLLDNKGSIGYSHNRVIENTQNIWNLVSGRMKMCT